MKNQKSVKAFITAIIIMTLLLSSGVANAIICHISLDKISQAVEATEIGDTENAAKIEDKFTRISFFMSVTTNHDDLEDAEEFIIDFKEAVTGDSKSELRLAKSRLVATIKQLKRLSGIGIDSII